MVLSRLLTDRRSVLTESNGTHAFQFSPARHWLLATGAQVNSPPVTELRCVQDGRSVCVLKQAGYFRSVRPTSPFFPRAALIR